MALESIKGANEAISINVMLVFFFQAIIVVLAVLDFINKRKATSEGSKGE